MWQKISYIGTTTIKHEDTYSTKHIKLQTQCSDKKYVQQWTSHPITTLGPIVEITSLQLAPCVQETNRHQHK